MVGGRRWGSGALPSPLVAVPLVVTAAVQGVVLGGGLQDEDFLHLFGVQRLGLDGYLVHVHGGHFMASFVLLTAALHGTFGLLGEAYCAATLLLHLLNVALLFGAARAWTGSAAAAAVAAALWGTTPVLQECLQSYSASNHVLSQTGLLWAIWELGRAAARREPPGVGALLRSNAALIAGAATQLATTTVTVAFPFLATILLPRESRPARTAAALSPAAVAASAMVAWALGSGAGGTVLLGSPEAIALLTATLVALGTGFVATGPLLTPTGRESRLALFDAGSAELAAAGGALLLTAAAVVIARHLVRSPRDRGPVFAFLGLSLASYGVIAIGRSAWVANDLLWLATQGRYQYDGTAGLVLAFTVVASRTSPAGLRLVPALRAMAAALAVGWVVASHVAASRTYSPGETRQEWTESWTELADAAIRRLVARAPAGSTVYVRNEHFAPAQLLYAMGIPKSDLPGLGAYWILAHGTEPLDGRRVLFVEKDERLVRRIRQEAEPRIAALFLSRQEAAARGANERSVLKHSPPEVAAYLSGSTDPLFRANAPGAAERARRALSF